MKGKFLVLEGIDGCGKTTQINHISKWLPKSGLMPKDAKLHITREPGGTLLGKALRDLLLNNPGINSPDPLTELLLYAADRAQHINQIIKPKLKSGDWVISDRFCGSTLAYQGFGRGINVNLIKSLEKIATDGINPDLTFLLKISVSNSIKRRSNKSKDRIESEGEVFLSKVALGFHEIARDKKWLTIEGDQEEKLVSREIETQLRFFLKDK